MADVNDFDHPVGAQARRLPGRGRRLEDWLLLFLAGEKSLQHVFVTWAFASDSFDLREQVVPPFEVLAVIGGVSAALFAVATGGVWRRRSWAADLLIGLALVDIVGEFVAQGTVMIRIVLSFIVASVVLMLAWRARRRYEFRESLDIRSA